MSELRYFIHKSAWLKAVPQDMGLPGQLGGNVWPYSNLMP
jgi:hypothetical protein